MSNTRRNSWQDIRDRIHDSIQRRVWEPGQLMPGEEALAEQFGCARTTVNRALRELASKGVVDRKRKAGTRVSSTASRHISANIPVLRAQIESRNSEYSFKVLELRSVLPPKTVKAAMQIGARQHLLHVRSVHYADNKPYAYEDRWLNSKTIPQVLKLDLQKINANEWLVEHVPLTRGEFVVTAAPVNRTVAKALELSAGSTVLNSRRTTWLNESSITLVDLYYAPGHQLSFVI